MSAVQDESAARIQASIARLMRLRQEGRLPAWTSQKAGTAHPGHGRASPEQWAGATMQRFGDTEAFVVRRSVAELMPEVPLAAELRQALAALTAAGDEGDADPGLRVAAGHTLEDLVVLDLETTGFWGCPIFLVGLLLIEDGELVSLQIMARDYPEEAAMLQAAVTILQDRPLLVTFNGKSYDAPCLRERCIVHRVPPPALAAHVDILHPARRQWREILPNCRLQTLERGILGLHRSGDVPSAEIPGFYHEFTATRDATALSPVLHHGRVDVLTTARLFARLAQRAQAE